MDVWNRCPETRSWATGSPDRTGIAKRGANARKEQSEIAINEYTELFDFAPSGYFVLSETGKIIELNLSGSQMLGKGGNI